MSALDAERLLRALAEVRYVLIGGFAVIAHTSVRTTKDLDIVPAPDEANLMLLGNVLVGINAHLAHDATKQIDPEIRLALAKGRTLSFATDFGALDVVQRLPGVPGYRELEQTAVTSAPFGIEIRVASRDMLVAMKRARRSAQDLADIEALEQAPGADAQTGTTPWRFHGRSTRLPSAISSAAADRRARLARVDDVVDHRVAGRDVDVDDPAVGRRSARPSWRPGRRPPRPAGA